MSFIEQGMDMLQNLKLRCRGITFVAILVSTAFLGFVVFSPLFITVFALKLQCARWIVDTVISSWFALAVATYEFIYGVNIVINGDVSRMDKYCSSLIIMNHRTRLDWLFYFSVQARYCSLRRFIISLKDGLRYAPGAGWAMQAKQFIFLRRNWEEDKVRIENGLKHFSHVNYNPQLLLFPEGTDFTPYTRSKSKEYAKKNDLPDYEFVLHPRTTGFVSVLGFMKNYNDLKQIVDVTIGYPQNMLQNETELLNGNIPREIVFNIQTFDAADLVSKDESELSKWLEERWAVKETYLKSFYELKTPITANGLSLNKNIDIERETYLFLIGVMLFWIFITFSTVWCLIFYTYYRWVFFTLTIVNTVIGVFVGFDHLFAKMSLI
ncbi:Lysocardiolipin acyltransferase 1 [Mactra antiquata]